jgi:hypothetical protein
MMNIEAEALKVGELKQRAADALAADDVEAFLDLRTERILAIEQLQEALLNDSVHVVRSPEAQRVLAEIDLSDIEDLDATGSRLLFSWFAPQDYALGLSRVDALIAPVPMPETLRTFVQEARQCYAFQQVNAVYSLCRTILEAAVNDLCVRTGRMPKHIVDEGLFDDERYTFRNRLKLLSSGPRLNRIHEHYRLLCRVVHGSTTVTWGDALAALVDTLGFVHQLYAIYQHAIRKGT